MPSKPKVKVEEEKNLASYIYMWPNRFAGLTWKTEESRERSLMDLVMGYPCGHLIFTFQLIDPSTSHLAPRLMLREAVLNRVRIVGNLPPFFIWSDRETGRAFQAGLGEIVAIRS